MIKKNLFLLMSMLLIAALTGCIQESTPDPGVVFVQTNATEIFRVVANGDVEWILNGNVVGEGPEFIFEGARFPSKHLLVAVEKNGLKKSRVTGIQAWKIIVAYNPCNIKPTPVPDPDPTPVPDPDPTPVPDPDPTPVPVPEPEPVPVPEPEPVPVPDPLADLVGSYTLSDFTFTGPNATFTMDQISSFGASVSGQLDINSNGNVNMSFIVDTGNEATSMNQSFSVTIDEVGEDYIAGTTVVDGQTISNQIGYSLNGNQLTFRLQGDILAGTDVDPSAVITIIFTK